MYHRRRVRLGRYEILHGGQCCMPKLLARKSAASFVFFFLFLSFLFRLALGKTASARKCHAYPRCRGGLRLQQLVCNYKASRQTVVVVVSSYPRTIPSRPKRAQVCQQSGFASFPLFLFFSLPNLYHEFSSAFVSCVVSDICSRRGNLSAM